MPIKETDWYNWDQKPVRIGIYKRDYGHGETLYCWFDGEYFGFASSDSSIAYIRYLEEGPSYNQNLPWKGMMK